MRRDYTQLPIRLMTTEGYNRCRQRKISSKSSHKPKLTTTLMIPMITYTKYTSYGYGWSVEYEFGSGGVEDMEAVQTFPFVPLFPSLHISLSLLWISAWYKWRRHWFLPPTTGGEASLCTGSAKRSPLSCTDRLWDLWVRTIAYVG